MKEVVKQEQNTALTAHQQSVMDQDVVTSDVSIPRLLLCQAISERVMEGKATVGQILRSTDNMVIAKKGEKFSIIPLKIENIWINQEIVGKKAEFRGMEPRTALNSDLPWNYQKDGTDWQRVKAITLYGILPQDVQAYMNEVKRAVDAGDAPDLNKTLMPVVITFQSTSFKPGAKPIADFFTRLKTMSQQFPNVGPFNYFIELSSKEEKGDKGMYFVWSTGNPQKLVDKEAIEAARNWYNLLQSATPKVDDTGIDGDVGSLSGSDLV